MSHGTQQPLVRAMEAVLLFMVTVAPWLFGAVHPLAELLLYGGLSALAALWMIRIVAARRPLWNPCTFSVGLALLCVLGIVQITPLPTEVLKRLSPATAQLRATLVPTSLTATVAADRDERAVPSTLSLAPDETRSVLNRLTALLLLFAVIRANLSTPATLQRLAIVSVVNGVLLSLLALAQFFSSPNNLVYWTFVSEGAVFGPFICRNHFAYYINLSIGLGLGLFLNTATFRRDYYQPAKVRGPLRALQDPVHLWLGIALVIMGAALCCSMSRGGIVAFMVGIVTLVCLYRSQAGKLSGWVSGFFFASLGLAFTAWLAAGLITRRLATLWQTNVLEEGRAPVWGRVLGTFANFPVLGTGMGTFRFVEPLTRGPTDSPMVVHEHMHNDYLEALIEGGLVQLAIVVLLVLLIFRTGFQVFRRERGSKAGNMALGSLFGLTAVAVQSTVDFGLHIPAVMALTITISACMSGTLDTLQAPPVVARGLHWRRLSASGLQIMAILFLTVFLLDSGWRSERSERYRLAAQAAVPAEVDKKIAYLESALAYTPDRALLHVAAAEAHRERGGALDTQQAFAHFIEARLENPCLVQPHLFMAAHGQLLPGAEDPETYLARACLLDPSNFRTWYVAGLKAWQAEALKRAWESWRRSLQCNGNHLGDILDRAAQKLGAGDLIEKVIPPDPQLLYKAYLHLRKSSGNGAAFIACLERALPLFEPIQSADSSHVLVQARIHAALLHPEPTIAAYRQALAKEPARFDWQLEFSQYLVDVGRLPDARRELNMLLSLQPENGPARHLYQSVIRDIAAWRPAQK